MSSFGTRRRLASGLAILAVLAATSVPAATAFARVTVIVVTESKKAVRSNVRVRVGHDIRPPVDTDADGSYVFETVSCTDKTQFKIEPRVRLYIHDDKWLPCQQTIVLRLRPVSIGAATPADLPAPGKRSASTLSG